jgi:hypothetical protein
MIEMMSLEEQVERDFSAARWRAFRGRLAGWLRHEGQQDTLLDFEASKGGAIHRVVRGRMIVEVARIVGSVGRHRDYDRAFMPVRAANMARAERWKRVDRAFHKMCDLPPVCLFKVEDRYFVYDGHNRVSVARYQGIEEVEAYVIEFRRPANPAREG